MRSAVTKFPENDFSGDKINSARGSFVSGSVAMVTPAHTGAGIKKDSLLLISHQTLFKPYIQKESVYFHLLNLVVPKVVPFLGRTVCRFDIL